VAERSGEAEEPEWRSEKPAPVRRLKQ